MAPHPSTQLRAFGPGARVALLRAAYMGAAANARTLAQRARGAAALGNVRGARLAALATIDAQGRRDSLAARLAALAAPDGLAPSERC